MQPKRIEELLPVVFRQAVVPGRPLDTFLHIMARMHAPAEKILDELDRYFDPRRAPEDFVPFLAAWVDIDFPVTTGRMRELIAGFVAILAMRGTRQGLIRLLEAATGMTGFEVEENPTDQRGEVRSFHIEVTAPAVLAPHARLLEVLIQREKPAYVTSSLRFKGE